MALRIPDRETLDRLAADYALGTMPDSARRRFERIVEVSPEARAFLTAWEERLVGLAEGLGEQSPPVSLRNTLTQAISDDQAAAAVGAGIPANDRGNVGRRAFLKGFAAASVVAVAAAGTFAIWDRKPRSIRPLAMAVLRDDKGTAALVIQVSAETGNLLSYSLATTPHGPTAPDGKHHHLWLISPKSKAPISLGAVNLSAPTTIGEEHRTLLATGVAAVSLETMTFDPNGGPKGPVLFKGTFRTVRQ